MLRINHVRLPFFGVILRLVSVRAFLKENIRVGLINYLLSPKDNTLCLWYDNSDRNEPFCKLEQFYERVESMVQNAKIIILGFNDLTFNYSNDILKIVKFLQPCGCKIEMEFING